MLRVTDARSDIGVEVFFSYRWRERGTWRLGYAFSKEEDFIDAYWSIQGPVLRSSSNAWYTREHQVSMGHQWDLGEGRLRPFVGVDACFGYLEESSSSASRSFALDSLQVGGGSGLPVSIESSSRYWEGLRLGLGGAAGLEYRPHRNLGIQLRACMAYIADLPLLFESVPDSFQNKASGLQVPLLGSGLFVQFKF